MSRIAVSLVLAMLCTAVSSCSSSQDEVTCFPESVYEAFQDSMMLDGVSIYDSLLHHFEHYLQGQSILEYLEEISYNASIRPDSGAHTLFLVESLVELGYMQKVSYESSVIRPSNLMEGTRYEPNVKPLIRTVNSVYALDSLEGFDDCPGDPVLLMLRKMSDSRQARYSPSMMVYILSSMQETEGLKITTALSVYGGMLSRRFSEETPIED